MQLSESMQKSNKFKVSLPSPFVDMDVKVVEAGADGYDLSNACGAE